MIARSEQRFARDAADVQTGAAELLVLFDNGGLQSELPGADGGDITARSGADDDDIKFFHVLKELTCHSARSRSRSFKRVRVDPEISPVRLQETIAQVLKPFPSCSLRTLIGA